MVPLRKKTMNYGLWTLNFFVPLRILNPKPSTLNSTLMADVTPMMKQFFDLKAKHPDAILLFRCGDFYETYSTDATEAADILGITLTKRNNGGKADEPIPMAGFPYHALDTYLPKLVRAGRRVAICDQLEDPKLTKKLVRGDSSYVTVIYGADVTEEQAQQLYEQLCNKFKDKLEITLLSGGQPVYYYLLSVE